MSVDKEIVKRTDEAGNVGESKTVAVPIKTRK